MSRELIYTSSVTGLQTGTRGFCTVACTKGMSQNLVTTLESLSGYRHLYPSGSPQQNPVVYSHLIIPSNTGTEHVVSRIADAGLDYSGRTNKIAHHRIFSDGELNSIDPGFIVSTPSNFLRTWTGNPRYLEPEMSFPTGISPTVPCSAWARFTGEAGWGGIVAQTADSHRSVSILCRPDQDVLPLILESLALLPPRKRWEVSWSSFYMKMPPGISCQWKVVLTGSPEESIVRQIPDGLLIDLTRQVSSLPLTSLESIQWADAARKGSILQIAEKRPPLVVKRVPAMRPVSPENSSLSDFDNEEIIRNLSSPGLDRDMMAKVNLLNDIYAEMGQNDLYSERRRRLIIWMVTIFVILAVLGSLAFVFRAEISSFLKDSKEAVPESVESEEDSLSLKISPLNPGEQIP